MSMRSDRLLAFGASAALALFLLSLIEVFGARIEMGDVYPVYSSLRSDAAGIKAYFESIGRLKGMKVSRRFDPLQDFRESDTTLFLFGVPSALLEHSVTAVAQFEQMASHANRVVVGLPVCSVAGQEKNPVLVMKRWSLAWQCTKASSTRPDYYVLTEVGSGWNVIANDQERRAVAAEQRRGPGSIVLVTDPYAFSNEGLLRQRNTEMLAAVLGRNTQVIFDEYHLGLSENEGIISLARRYRLHGFTAGLFLLAALFVWRNSSSFLPQLAAPAVDEVSGRDTGAGFTSLLRRAIPAREILSVCVTEWKRSMQARTPQHELERVDSMVKDDPVKAYREIATFLNERRKL
jgi:hypothetical protein